MIRGEPENLPAPSTLQARRRRKPIFIDEPIQWHLRNSKHDRCPWCGLQDLGNLTLKRTCENSLCGIEIGLPCLVREWLELKHRGKQVIYNTPPKFYPTAVLANEVYDLQEAQLRSETGRGVATISAGIDVVRVYWHRVGHLPESFDGKPACAAGSDYWRMLLELREVPLWRPDEELNAMEVIARAATDEPMFAIMDG